MEQRTSYRLMLIAVFLALVAAVTLGVWRYGLGQAMDQLSQRGKADLALASDRLTAQLQRYQELAVLLSDHPVLLSLDPVTADGAARALLLAAADKTTALEVLFADHSGTVLASAHGPVGANVANNPAFRRALQGALGAEHGVRPVTMERVYTYAAPAFGPDGKVVGAVMVTLDIENVEWDWRGSNPAVFFTDADGVVFISNRSELLFWQQDQVGIKPVDGREVPFSARQLGWHRIWEMSWGPYLPQQALHLTRPLPVIGMTGSALIDLEPARAIARLQAAAVAALCLAFGALLFLATERRRTLADANAVLESRVAQRTEALSDANIKLRREIGEREEAEAALKRAQADLVQAGKLSALGQMSAGISHELNQPLMAIRSFAENGAQFLDRGKVDVASANLNRISELARRMGRIIQNLRAFARQENEPLARVDVVSVLDGVIELTEARLRDEGVDLIYVRPDQALWVRGGEVRLGQVFLNLITNAIDAMSESDPKHLTIELMNRNKLAVKFRDTGPGISVPDKVFDPFYSTKEVGASEGMGLGLSISYGIVQSFGGEIRGRNLPDRGAEFSVELDPWVEEKAA